MAFLEQQLNRKIILFSFSLLLAGAIFYPALFSGKVMGTDAIELNIPQMAFYKQVLQNGGTPFWNPNVAVGFPNFISIQGFPYSPVNWLLFAFSPITAHYIGITLTIALALFFGALFLRELGISIWGSLIGSLAYVAGNIHFDRDVVLATAVMIQVIDFWVLMKIYKAPDFRFSLKYYVFGALTVGYGWLMTSYFPTLYIFTGLVAFALFLGSQSVDRKAALKKLFLALFIVFAIGTIIGLLQLVPTYVLTQFSQRSGGFGAEALQGYSINWYELSHFFFLTPRRGLDAYLFIGIAPLIYLIFSFWNKKPMAEFFRWFFLIVLLISIKHSPLFWLLAQLPIFDLFQGAARFMLVGMLGAGVSVGFGFDYLANLIAENKTSEIRKKFMVLATAIAALLLLVWKLYPESVLLSVALSFGALLLIAAPLLFNQWKIFLPTMILLAVIEFVIIFYNFNQTITFDKESYKSGPPVVEYLQKNTGRLLPIFVDDWDDVFFYNYLSPRTPNPEWEENPQGLVNFKYKTLYPNYHLLHGIANLEVNEPLLNVAVGRLMALVGPRQLVASGGEEKLDKLHATLGKVDNSARAKLIILLDRSALLDFLGIRYLLSMVDLRSVENNWPNLQLVGTYGISLADDAPRNLPVGLYESKTVKPLAYFAQRPIFKSDESEIYQLFKGGNFRDIYVQCADCGQTSFDGLGKVNIGEEKAGIAKVSTNSPKEQFLVFTQNYLPGWRAFVDGQEVEMYKVNTVFPGIFVPAGEHKVEFRYDYWQMFSLKLIFGQNNE